MAFSVKDCKDEACVRLIGEAALFMQFVSLPCLAFFLAFVVVLLFKRRPGEPFLTRLRWAHWVFWILFALALPIVVNVVRGEMCRCTEPF
jgi:hypothetical protein